MLNLSYLHELQISQPSSFLWVWSWWGHVDAGGKLAEPGHCKQLSFLGKSTRGLFQFPPTPVFHLGPCTHCQGFDRGSHRALILLRGSSSRLAAPASSSPGLPAFVLSYSDSAFGIHHSPHICNLWPGWSFKAQTNLASPRIKSILNPAIVLWTFLVAYPESISPCIPDFYSDIHTFSIHFFTSKKANHTPNSRNGSALLK